MTFLSKRLIKLTKQILCLSAFAMIFSCNPMTKITKEEVNRLNNELVDSNINLTRKQYKDALIPKRESDSKDRYSNKRKNRKSNSGDYIPDTYNEPSIPEVSNILSTPVPASIKNDKLISISVTEEIPLKDVLMELSRLADIDMEIDPRINGGIILRVKDKPFNSIIQRVAKLGGLRYTVDDNVMRVERDTPYKKDYIVDFLNVTRSFESSINVDTSSLGSSESESPSGSTSSTTQSSEADVWVSIEEALTNILSFTAQTNIMSSGDFDSSAITQSSSLQINRQAGIISVIATNEQHESVSQYLEAVREQVSTQVLIEAKVVEVTLDEQYRSGVDWGNLSNHTLGLTISGNFDAGIGNSADFFKITADNGAERAGSSLSSAISFTEQFGTTRTISSPRLHATNNQQAVLSFAENRVFFNIEAEEEEDEDANGATSTTLNIDAEPVTVPVGVILNLMPSINNKTSEITMHVRPTLTRVTSTINDPGVQLLAARNNVTGIVSEIPIVEVREMDSILKIRSGEIMVIGGLMQDIQSSTDKGIPFFNRAPVVGNLFKSTVQSTDTVETVIFIKATIIKNNDSRSVEKQDKNFYNTFAPRDPRPLAF
jgi:MSHA type pilus biogenesis protein MshL